MRVQSRRRALFALAAAIGAFALTPLDFAEAQQRSGLVKGDPAQVRLNENGDPEFSRGRSRVTGFNLFGFADVALSSLKTTSDIFFAVRNTGRHAEGGNFNARVGDGDPDLPACCAPVHFRYLELYWSAPPSERAKIIAEAGVAGSGLQFALGGGYTVIARNMQNGGDLQLPVDGTLGTLHSGAVSTTDGSCRDVQGGNFGAGNPLLALSDCPETWGSLGWRGRAPVTIDSYLGEARGNPAGFSFDFWKYPEGEPANGALERQFGSFQTYGLFSDYTRDDLCGTPTTRTYGRVIKPAVDACPAGNATKPGYPLGIEARHDAFIYAIPALKDIGYYQYTIVNKSEELYGVGIDYDSLYLGIGTGYFSSGQENQIYYRPELGAVISTGVCSQVNCNNGRNVSEFTPARLSDVGRGPPYGAGVIAMVVLKSPIGDLRNKLLTQTGSPFSTVPGLDPEMFDDTITFNHAHMCGFRACAGTTWATSELNADHTQRPFGLTSSTEVNVLGTRPITDPTFANANSQVLWHTFRSYDWPARPPVGPGAGQFPQTGGFNRWVPGTRTGEGPNVQWDWDGDGTQDTLFLDSCSGKSGGQTLNTSCAGIFSDTLPNGYLNAYGNVGSIVGVGPIKLAAGDTTSFVIAQLGACCGLNDADSTASMTKIKAAIDHYMGFYLGPEQLPKDTIVAVDVVGGAAEQSQVTLTFTQTAESVVDLFLLNAAATTAAPAPGTAADVLLQLNPWLADSLRLLGLQFGATDTTVNAAGDTTFLTAIGNFQELYVFKSCDGGVTWTNSANCGPARATGGVFADLGWLPYATLGRDADGDVTNTFTDPNVVSGVTYTYALIGLSRGASFSVINGTATQKVGTATDSQFVCVADCRIETLEFAPQLFNALATAGPNVANVYVPASAPGGSARPVITVTAPVGFERLTVTPARNRPDAGTYTVRIFDSVTVSIRDSTDADGRARFSTTSEVTGWVGDAETYNATLNAVGGVGLNGATLVAPPVHEIFPTYRIRTTEYVFNGMTAVLASASAPLLVTNDFSGTATPETFHSSAAFPGFTISFAPAAVRAFNSARGEVFIGPDGNRIQILAIPYARTNLTATVISSASQGGLYTLDWEARIYGPGEPFTLNLANPQATRDAVTASLNARTVAQTGVTDAAAQAATGFTDLVPVKLPFTVTNETFGRPVQVAMRQRASNNILLGSGQDTITVAVPADVWIPGDRLIFLEDIGGTTQVTFGTFVVECPTSPGTRASCNPVALLTPGSTGFIPTLAGTEQSVLYNPALTTSQQFSFVVAPQALAGDLITECTNTPTGEVCTTVKASIKDVKVVPNPYLVFSDLAPGLVQPLLFTHVPPRGTIRIYTVAGQFVQQITWEEQDLNETGDLLWDLQTRENSTIAAGLYLFMVSGQNADGGNLGSHMGKFVVIR